MELPVWPLGSLALVVLRVVSEEVLVGWDVVLGGGVAVKEGDGGRLVCVGELKDAGLDGVSLGPAGGDVLIQSGEQLGRETGFVVRVGSVGPMVASEGLRGSAGVSDDCISTLVDDDVLVALFTGVLGGFGVGGGARQ